MALMGKALLTSLSKVQGGSSTEGSSDEDEDDDSDDESDEKNEEQNGVKEENVGEESKDEMRMNIDEKS